MKKILPILLILLVAFLSEGNSQGLENFDNSNATSGYSDNNFVGENGISWYYVQSRNGNNDANSSGINLPALMLRRVASSSKVYSSTISGGIGSFSIKLYKGFTGSGNRQVELFINDASYGTSTPFDDFNEHIFSVSNINVSGDIVIRIDDITSKQVIVDDISWTGYGGGASVAAPTFNPPAGTYLFNPQNVTISTTTAGATIYYTTDGSDPDNTSAVYTVPVNIATNTTLKAFAVLSGVTDSQITSGDYVINPVAIADMATLRTQAVGDGTIYQLNSEVILTYQQSYRDQKYIQDGTGGILIDDNAGKLTTTYSIGDGITGIIGTLGSYRGMLQFIPQEDAGAATSTGNVIVPVFITVTEFVNNFEDYEGQVVKIDYLTFADAKDTFYNGNVYPVTDNNSNAMDFRTTFYGVDYIGTIIPPFPRDIVGIANQRDDPYLTARNSADITNTPAAVPLGSTGIIIAVLLITAVLVIRRGRLI